MYKKMLVAVDGSENTANVLDQALTLGVSEGVAVDLVVVVPAYQGELRMLGDTRVLQNMQDHYQQALNAAMQQALARGVRTRAHLREGEPAEEILALAEEIGADLVAIGRRSNFIANNMFLGSVSADVMSQCSVDVLVVPGTRALGLETVFLAYDGTRGADLAARSACALAARYGAKLVVGTSYELDPEAYVMAPKLDRALRQKAEDTQQVALAMARDADIQRVEAMIRHGSPTYQVLADAAQECGAGLAVVGSRGRSKLARLLLGNVAGRLASISQCPVLVVKQ